MADPTGLTGKVALITGAARYRGIGRAIALRLAETGQTLSFAADPAHQHPSLHMNRKWVGGEWRHLLRKSGRKDAGRSPWTAMSRKRNRSWR